MKRQEYKVVFEPTGRQVYVLAGSILLEAAAQAGLILQTPCGGTGQCGKCRVRVVSGNCMPSAACLAAFSRQEIESGFRLACRAKVGGDLRLEIPAESLFESQQQILVQGTGDKLHLQPAVGKFYVDLGKSAPAGALSDVERLRAAIRPAEFNSVSIATMRLLPAALRQNHFKGTVVIADRELIGFEPGDSTARSFGIAIDLGTTTLVGAIIDLNTGAEVAVDARINPQTSYGDDVISRLRLCREDEKGLARLQRVIIGAVNDIIDKLVDDARIRRADVYEVVLAGNTTMQQIACGIDPSALGEMPFVPAFTHALDLAAVEMGLEINGHGRVYVFPQIGGFVGGDTVAGLVASRLAQGAETILFVDIGTNGEIVLKHGGLIMAASVAAGPAFEGARISCGMRATAGAIEKIIINDDLACNVIGNTRPVGLCGSGLIDLVAELRRTGLMESSGRILAAAELPPAAPAAVKRRLIARDGQNAFTIAGKAESATGQPLLLTQKDVREMQLANAAIRSGINILLKLAGIDHARLDSVLLAGGFGNFIRRNHARCIGLLPPVPSEKIRFIGNASLMGARRALLSVAEKDFAERMAREVRHVDLSLSPEFQAEFSDAIFFPEEVPHG